MNDKARLAQLEALLVVMLQRQDKLEAVVAELQAERDLVEQRLQRLESLVEAQQANQLANTAASVNQPQQEFRNTQQTLSYLLDELQRTPRFN
jgi:histidinol-phosphate/aromatic aminotransferase/cobyric acid decarboxylase-like protein